MTWVQIVSRQDTGMTLSVIGDSDYYLTIPLGAGALEIDEDKKTWYREWAPDHGVIREDALEPVPDAPLEEQAAFIRILIKKTALKRSSSTTEYMINEACRKAMHANQEISHGTARMIAVDYADQSTEAFVFTGVIDSENIWWFLFGNLYGKLSEDDRLAADMLGTYLTSRRKDNDLGPVDNWVHLPVD